MLLIHLITKCKINKRTKNYISKFLLHIFVYEKRRKIMFVVAFCYMHTIRIDKTSRQYKIIGKFSE